MNLNPSEQLQFLDFFGKKELEWAIGVVEDNNDPLTLGRVKARWFGYHNEDRTLMPTKDLPWATVIQPTNSASISGIGWSPNGLERGSWVFGFFADGKYAQQPFIIGTFPSIHKAANPGEYGGTGDGYRNDNEMNSGIGGTGPYNGNSTSTPNVTQTLPNTPGSGATIKDDGSYLTKANAANWPLQYYKPTPSRSDNGLACKDANQSLYIHLATANALENLTRDFGKGAFRINSAYRSPAYNKSVGGASGSLHVKGRAFDISKSSIGGQNEISRFANLAVKNGFTGFGWYGSFIHIDTGQGRVWGNPPKWFTDALTSGGWYQGKPGLSGVKATPGVTTTEQTPGGSTTADPATATGSTQNSTGNAGNLRQMLKAKGYNDIQIAGIMGSAMQESGLNPTATNSIGAYGLFQWLGPRRTALNNYAASRGLSPADMSTQVDFFHHEMQTTERRSASMLASATTVDEAVTAMNYYERFSGYQAGKNGRETGRRYEYAAQYYNGSGPNPSSMPGFQDPTNSLPYNDYKGSPSTHPAARGLNSNLNQPTGIQDNSARISAIPIAGDIGTFGEPESAFNPQYPYNKTYGTKSGHLIEFDDTPNSERINISHKSGSKFEMSAKGTVVMRSQGNHYSMVNGTTFTASMGEYYLTSRSDMKIRTTADLLVHADGSMEFLGKNDFVLTVSGKSDIGVAETLQIKAKKLIIEADSIDLYSKGDFNIQAEGALNMKAKSIVANAAEGLDMKGKETKIQSAGDMSLKATTVYADDTIRMAEGGSKDAANAPDAKSTDIGSIAPRAKIKRVPEARTNPDSYNTMDDGYNNYGDG